jgi:hypothetical protein
LYRPSRGNVLAAKHGVFSKDRRMLEPRAQEIAERILEAPHTVELDEIGAVEIGRLEALIETIDRDLAERGRGHSVVVFKSANGLPRDASRGLRSPASEPMSGDDRSPAVIRCSKPVKPEEVRPDPRKP